jgi:hypothetical protein
VRHWVWLLVGVGACTSGAGSEADSGGAGSSESSTCPPSTNRISGACSVGADVRCASGHWDCLCPGRIPFAVAIVSTCVNGAWKQEPTFCGCDVDGGEAGGGGSAGSDLQ